MFIKDTKLDSFQLRLYYNGTEERDRVTSENIRLEATEEVEVNNLYSNNTLMALGHYHSLSICYF